MVRKKRDIQQVRSLQPLLSRHQPPIPDGEPPHNAARLVAKVRADLVDAFRNFAIDLSGT
jgi:hypothetical protein